MAQVEITINDRKYNIACDDGEEARVRTLAAYVDEKTRAIAGTGSGSESHLLLVTALVLADEISELRDGARHGAESRAGTDAVTLEAVRHLTGRVSALADSLERAKG